MLKTRIIPTMLYKDFGLVKGKGFDKSRRTGSLMQAVKVYNLREVDELVYLDVAATAGEREPDYSTIAEMARECFCPLAVGGGIATLEQARKVFLAGADKIVLNTFAFKEPKLIREVASLFGSQAVIVSIDARCFKEKPLNQKPLKKENKKEIIFTQEQNGNVFYEVIVLSGKEDTSKDVVEWAKEVETLGAGEILLTSIEKDGFMQGYDLDLIKQVAEAVKIPVIAGGGAGKLEDFAMALKAGAHAVSAASLFHFTPLTPLEVKQYLKENNFNVRIN
ncbi:MAG: imidazole glycerol phosphate synthase cyclase subunit [bacterium]|nr:imidazole glycerol phosphate synthase cyclase subunit [bacterium]